MNQTTTSKPLVLIADDHAINRRLLQKILSDEYALLEASDGTMAYQLLENYHQKLAAVVLDFHMPGLNADEILRRIAEHDLYQNIPILIATGLQEAELEQRCLKLGAWDFISKPYDAQILKLRLHNIIGRRDSHLLKQIRFMAERDQLTGLYNRNFFLERTQALIAAHPDTTFALVRMDIDRFRLYNTSFGKEAGDQLLKLFASSIHRDLSKLPRCTYGRIESDVFCLCLPYNHEVLIQELESATEHVHILCDNYRLELVFGVYIFPDSKQNVEEAYSYASEASRKCKNQFNVSYLFYDQTMHEQQVNEQRVINDMEQALKEEQFLVYLQPKYSLNHNVPCGAEALVRWQHPERGMIPPSEFIPVFERNGLIERLDHYMWEHVCMLLHSWLIAGKKVDPISVNVSRISLYNPSVVDDLIQLTEQYELPHSLLHLEITESAYMSNPDLMKTVLEQLRNNGFVLLMDDFGSGYSSLNTLKDIEMDILKIDMKFLPSGEDHAKSEKILASITRMAGWLGMPVVVEGVETKAQKDFLMSIGCGYVQGYYFARPMPVADYEALVQKANDSLPVLPDESFDLSNIDAIWSMDPKTSDILRSMTVPFIILEYTQNSIDILRMNQECIRIFGENKNSILSQAPEELTKLYVALDEIVANKRESSCDCLYVFANGIVKWFRIHMQMIQAISNSILVGATFTDITKERLMEAELNRVFHAIRGAQIQKHQMLIVDDSEISIAILEKLFEADYHILTASNGKEALDILIHNSDDIAIILLDMMMPVMTGQEFLAQKSLLPQAADIPVIVISADSSEALQINMLQSGVHDYITKPFVPQTVVKRVKNVLDYSTRFRALAKEFNNINQLDVQDEQIPSRKTYSPQEVSGMIEFMSHIFDVVRVVDPTAMVVLEFDKSGGVNQSSYSCYKVWEKDCRCDNCSSLCALQSNCMLSKYEFIRNDIFYVISQPICITQGLGQPITCILEIVSHITDHIMMKEISGQSIEELLEDTRQKIYSDSLTGAYNRRYYDEMQFLRHEQGRVPDKIGLILLDMVHFKYINDFFGHTEGDRILMEVAHALNTQIRSADSVIRYGGDEFVVILTGCEAEQLPITAMRLKQSIQQITYGENRDIPADVDFGYAYTAAFQRKKSHLQELFQQADEQMYHHKLQHANHSEQ